MFILTYQHVYLPIISAMSRTSRSLQINSRHLSNYVQLREKATPAPATAAAPRALSRSPLAFQTGARAAPRRASGAARHINTNNALQNITQHYYGRHCFARIALAKLQNEQKFLAYIVTLAA